MDNLTITDSAAGKGEIVVYQPDEVTRLEVKVEDETVWLNRNQMALLFGRDVKTIGKHVNNALTEELKSVPTVAFFATVQKEGSRYVERKIEYYNLDMILSVGYRVKSEQGIRFRRWANEILKEYLLKGYSMNHRLMLAKRQTGVAAEIRTGRITETLKQDLLKHNTQYPPIVMTQNKNIHDRFLIVDEDVYHIGASLKDLGKKLFAFSKMNINPSLLYRSL